jgi:hypothetical protein
MEASHALFRHSDCPRGVSPAATGAKLPRGMAGYSKDPIQYSCTICGQKFLTTRTNPVTCGRPECRVERNRRANREAYRKKAGQGLAQFRGAMRAHHRAYKAQVNNRCQECGALIWPNYTRCRACSGRARRGSRPNSPSVRCWGCGLQVRRAPSQLPSKRVYCSDCSGMYAEAARKLGLSRERVRQLVERARVRQPVLTPREALRTVFAARGSSPDPTKGELVGI